MRYIGFREILTDFTKLLEHGAPILYRRTIEYNNTEYNRKKDFEDMDYYYKHFGIGCHYSSVDMTTTRVSDIPAYFLYHINTGNNA